MSEILATSEDAFGSAVPQFKDRRVGLLVFGILLILLGALCLLMVGLMVFGMSMASRTTGASFSMRMMVPGMIFYVGMAAAFIWLGIGSIQCRRWARALLLIWSWTWLASGIIGAAAMATFLPRVLSSSTGNAQNMPATALWVMLIVQIVIVGIFFVMVPGVLTFFYSSRHVKATCETRDPVGRWTDLCPLPVLGVACWLWAGAVMLLCFPVMYNGVMPFFGTLVSGLPGALIAIAFAGLWLWIGRLWHQLRAAGWWLLLGTLILWGTSIVITVSRVDMLEMYEKMGYPQAQIDMIQQRGMFSGPFPLWMFSAWLIPVLGYLLWVKRFFPAAQKRPEKSPL